MNNTRLYIKDVWYHVIYRWLLRAPVAILMYHSVGYNKLFFTVTPESFRWQMQYLRQKGYHIARLSNVVDDLKYGRNLPRHTVALTFDDGYEDNFTNVLPVLEEFGIPATIFVSTDFIGTTRDVRGIPMKHVSREQLVQLQKSDLVDIQAHGMSHRRLTTLDTADARREMERSQWQLADIVGKPCTLFAYPFGDVDPRIKAVARSLFSGAVGVRRGYAIADSDVFELPRQSIDSAVSSWRFFLKC